VEALPLGIAVSVAFVAGVVSFASPCVLPLVPSYLSFVTGVSLEDLEAGVDRRNTLVHSVLFVLGFSTIFVLLGAVAFFLGQFVRQFEVWIPRVGGALIILLGLHLAGAFRIVPLMRERRLAFRDKPAGYFGTVAVGMAFAAGWVPCLTPVLAGVLTLASSVEHVDRGIGLLTAYSAGIGLPLIAAAMAVERFLETFQRFRRFLPVVQIVCGVVLVVLGLLLVTGTFTALSAYLYRLTPEWLYDFEYRLIGSGS
jgi:cytochrome c-type biogenesis protein